MSGPLKNLKVVLLGGIGPAPFCAMLLADLGADVIRVVRAGSQQEDPLMGTRIDALGRGQRGVALDLKLPSDKTLALNLIDQADVVIEGFRPGTLERLGLGPDVCLARNTKLVYTRITGWGQTGPLCLEPGHDIDFIALTGALDQVGSSGGPPVPALNLLADFAGGGVISAFGVLAAIYHAHRTGEGQVIDAAMFEGVNTLMTLQHALAESGRHNAPRGENLLDGGAPFNSVYRCKDGLYVAVGAIEPPFYKSLLVGLGLLNDPLFANQDDRENWPKQKQIFATVFAQEHRDDWLKILSNPPCCVSPVLSLQHAPSHPHAKERSSFFVSDGLTQPAPVPRFSKTIPDLPRFFSINKIEEEKIRGFLSNKRWPSF